MCLYQIVLLVFVLCVARNDRPVRQTGLSFLVYLLIGALCGQGMVLATSHQYLQIGLADEVDSEEVFTWADCHAQAWLLLLHLELHAAPLAAKMWRVWYKIRTAETRQLQLWDTSAQRWSHVQIFAFACLVVAHVVHALADYDATRRAKF